MAQYQLPHNRVEYVFLKKHVSIPADRDNNLWPVKILYIFPSFLAHNSTRLLLLKG